MMTSPRGSDEERIAFLSLDGRSSGDNTYDYDEFPLKSSKKRTSLSNRIRIWLTSRPRVLRRNAFRHPLLTILIALKYLGILLAILLVAVPILAPSYTRPPPHYTQLKKQCEGTDAAAGCGNPFNEKVFISISLYDKGGHLASGRWGEQVLELIQILGPDNVFLSIYENDSPLGEAPLEDFKSRVTCQHEIVFDKHVSLEGFANVTMPDGTERMKRLSYLSEMRNRALRPLDRFRAETGVVPFDKVLFLNDIFFHVEDAAQLLFSTNVGLDGRTHYLSTCAMDYNHPFLFYDLYAQRDAEGYSNGLPIYPVFSTAGQGLSRQDMLDQKDAVRVTSCWSGMVAMQAKYVQNLDTQLPTPNFQEVGAHVIKPDYPVAIEAPVRFRYEPEVFFDACECCLFLADVSTAARKDKDATEHGVFVNPFVRVAYDEWTLGWVHRVKRWERLFSIPQRIISWYVGLPRNNPYREVQEGEPFTEEIWVDDHWELVERTGRSGLFCAVREMQLIQRKERTEDKNWKNVEMPPGQHLWFPT